MPEPTTQKGQLDALFSIVGASDFASAQAGITNLKTAESDWKTQRQDLFAALGGTGDVPDHYDFATAMNGWKDQQKAIFGALGATDHASAVDAVKNLTSQNNSLNANQTTIFAALGATDLAGAMRAIRNIDDRIEAGVQAGVIARAASAGITEPIKQQAKEESESSKNVTRAAFMGMSPKQQLEFSKAGGKLVDETAAVAA